MRRFNSALQSVAGCINAGPVSLSLFATNPLAAEGDNCPRYHINSKTADIKQKKSLSYSEQKTEVWRRRSRLHHFLVDKRGGLSPPYGLSCWGWIPAWPPRLSSIGSWPLDRKRGYHRLVVIMHDSESDVRFAFYIWLLSSLFFSSGCFSCSCVARKNKKKR